MAGGRILALDRAAWAMAVDHEISLPGRTAIPGLIDIHTHGAAGADTCDGTLEAVQTIAEAKLREGVTTFLPTTLTLPPERLMAAVQAVAAYRQEPGFAKIPGLHIEGPFINPQCAGAQNPAFARSPDVDEILALHAIAPVLIVSLAAELPGALPFIAELRRHGIVSSLAHTAATFSQFRQAQQAGLTHLTHLGNQMTPLHHREIGIVGAALADTLVRFEMICDGHHLSPDMVRMVLALKEAQDTLHQVMLITDSMAASHLGDGVFTLGGLAATVREGVARLGNGALAGSTLQLIDAVHRVAAWTGWPLDRVVPMAGAHQVDSLGEAILGTTGRLTTGATADIVTLDAHGAVQAVWVEGECRWER
jgi:N-acetylglucosamine-6-phosphate deacetylase